MFPLNEHTYIELVERDGADDDLFYVTLALPKFCGIEDDFVGRWSSTYATRDKALVILSTWAMREKAPVKATLEDMNDEPAIIQLEIIEDPSTKGDDGQFDSNVIPI